MGKGDWTRPSQITREEATIRWQLAYGRITFKTFERKYKALKKRGLITRSGKSIE